MGGWEDGSEDKKKGGKRREEEQSGCMWKEKKRKKRRRKKSRKGLERGPRGTACTVIKSNALLTGIMHFLINIKKTGGKEKGSSSRLSC